MRPLFIRPFNVPLGLIGVGAVWLIISPFVLGYTGIGQALWNNIAVGGLFLALCAWTWADPRAGVEMIWWNMALALWLVVSPFVLYYFYVPAPLWNDIGMGFLIAVLTAWSSAMAPFWPHYRSYRRPPSARF